MQVQSPKDLAGEWKKSLAPRVLFTCRFGPLSSRNFCLVMAVQNFYLSSSFRMVWFCHLLQVQVPSSGSETIECGVCQHPFLVSAHWHHYPLAVGIWNPYVFCLVCSFGGGIQSLFQLLVPKACQFFWLAFVYGFVFFYCLAQENARKAWCLNWDVHSSIGISSFVFCSWWNSVNLVYVRESASTLGNVWLDVNNLVM